MKKPVYFMLNIQKFAEIDSIISENVDSFAEGDDTKASLEKVSTKLKDLGYDVLINKRDAAEFVPSSRLSDVVAQRESFKKQAEDAIRELTSLKGQSGLSDDAQQKLDTMIKTNEALVSQLQETSIQMEIMSNASDAINAKDIIPFVNKDMIKLDKDGKIVGGVKEEIERIRAEKPYLFTEKQTNSGKSTKGGIDPGEKGGAKGQKADMNAAIRAAAFGSSRSF